LLWSSPEVHHLDWQPYEVVLSPALSHTTLILEAYYANDVPYGGHIMLDHIVAYARFRRQASRWGPTPCFARANHYQRLFSPRGAHPVEQRLHRKPSYH
jgi:hypothetical protein